MGCPEESLKRVWKLLAQGEVLQEHSLLGMEKGLRN